MKNRAISILYKSTNGNKIIFNCKKNRASQNFIPYKFHNWNNKKSKNNKIQKNHKIYYYIVF